MFATDESEKDPIVVYKLYAQKRPKKMNEDHFPFYLAVNNNLKAESLQTKEWFKVGPVGINKLYSLMKTWQGYTTNITKITVVEKTMIQTLSKNDIPPTRITQLSGHKNLKSIENYSKVLTKQQMKMSQVLSSVVAGTATKTSQYEKANLAISPSTSESQQSLRFCCAF